MATLEHRGRDCKAGIAALLTAAIVLAGCTRLSESEGLEPAAPPRGERAAAPGAQPIPGEAEQEAAATPESETGAPTELTPEERYEIFQGTGGVIGRPSRSTALASVAEDGDITLNFVDADIREVLRATLGEILGVNYSVAPDVQGAVTVQSARPVSRDALIPTLGTILRMNGVALVQEGNLYRVEALQGGARANTSIRLGMAGAGAGEAYGIQVVPLQYVGAAQMAEALRPISREGGVLYVDETRNIIMLGGTRFELASLLEAVEIFDVDWLSGMSFGLFRLAYADAATMTEELGSVLGDGGQGVAGGLVKLVPLERLNAVLAVSRQRRYLEQVRQWVARLDTAGSGGGGARQLFIYFVQNGKAADLAEVLNEVFASSAELAARREISQIGEIAPGLEPAEMGAGVTETLTAAEASAAPEAPEVQPPRSPALPAPTNGIRLARESQTRIVADEERNALLISGTQAEYRAVVRALKQLDRRPLEVLIEVTIADVTLSDQLRYGVRWFFESGNHTLTFSNLETGAVTSQFPGLSYVYAVTNAKGVLDLLSSITHVEVISAPQLFVLNNQEAQLQVGDQVPVATRQAVDVSDPNAPIVNSVELRDTGVILNVTPRVNESGLVILEIEQEVSAVRETAASEATVTPTISTRVITTTAAVHSGQTVALGGLIQDNKTNTKVGIPGLSAIPFLGALFRYTTDTITRNELLVLVTPRVIRDQIGAMEMTQELRRRMEDLERLEAKVEPKVDIPEEEGSEEEPEGESPS